METWIRLAIFALILLSFLRRAFKAKSRTGIPAPTRPTPDAKNQAPPVFMRPASGRKNDFRDVPPPPENPELG